MPDPSAPPEAAAAELTAALVGVRASTADLLLGLEAEKWSDADVAAPSLCAGWTRGHVLTHLARNADGVASTLAGALRGEIVARYPDGWDARNADIERGAGRPATELLADVRESAERLDRVLGAVADADGWALPTELEHPAGHWPYRRWREVEIHRIDLAGAYTPDRWPPAFVARVLAEAAEGLGDRTSEPLTVTITAEGSVVPDLVGRTWGAGGGDTGGVEVAGAEVGGVEVAGPDWAVLAWLLGRAEPVRDALTAAPELGPWR